MQILCRISAKSNMRSKFDNPQRLICSLPPYSFKSLYANLSSFKPILNRVHGMKNKSNGYKGDIVWWGSIETQSFPRIVDSMMKACKTSRDECLLVMVFVLKQRFLKNLVAVVRQIRVGFLLLFGGYGIVVWGRYAQRSIFRVLRHCIEMKQKYERVEMEIQDRIIRRMTWILTL